MDSFTGLDPMYCDIYSCGSKTFICSNAMRIIYWLMVITSFFKMSSWYMFANGLLFSLGTSAAALVHILWWCPHCSESAIIHLQLSRWINSSFYSKLPNTIWCSKSPDHCESPSSIIHVFWWDNSTYYIKSPASVIHVCWWNHLPYYSELTRSLKCWSEQSATCAKSPTQSTVWLFCHYSAFIWSQHN